jgi:hypothetical protein
VEVKSAKMFPPLLAGLLAMKTKIVFSVFSFIAGQNKAEIDTLQLSRNLLDPSAFSICR